jgi:hypothetical protein
MISSHLAQFIRYLAESNRIKNSSSGIFIFSWWIIRGKLCCGELCAVNCRRACNPAGISMQYSEREILPWHTWHMFSLNVCHICTEALNFDLWQKKKSISNKFLFFYFIKDYEFVDINLCHFMVSFSFRYYYYLSSIFTNVHQKNK